MPIAARLAWLAFVGALALACGPKTEAKGAEAPRFTGVLRFYPLETGLQWSFTAHDSTAPGIGLLVVTKCVSFDGHVAMLSRGPERSELRIESDGIVRVDSGAYLLKEPMALGDKWPGAKGATVEVTAVDKKITVDAGSYEGCVVTTETFRGDTPGILTTTYCPQIGPVQLEIRETVAMPGEPLGWTTARLRSFGPALEFDKK